MSEMKKPEEKQRKAKTCITLQFVEMILNIFMYHTSLYNGT